MKNLTFSSKNKILTLNNDGKILSIGVPSVWKKINKINEIQGNEVFLIDILLENGNTYEEIVDFSAYLSDLLVPLKDRVKYFKGINLNNIEVRNII